MFFHHPGVFHLREVELFVQAITTYYALYHFPRALIGHWYFIYCSHTCLSTPRAPLVLEHPQELRGGNVNKLDVINS